MAWCRAKADELELRERQRTRKVGVAYDPACLIESGKCRMFSGGYLFLQDVYCSLGLPQVCEDIAKKRRFDYDLDTILSRMVYGRILEPASKRATYELSQTLIEAPNFDEHHIYRALSVLKENFGLSRFAVCTDTGLSSLANRKFNSKAHRRFITTQLIKKLKGYLRNWALSPKD